MNKRYTWLEKEYDSLRKQSLAREWNTVESASDRTGTWIQVEGKRLLNLSSNNYLGLAHDQRIVEAGNMAAEEWGAGGTASRLVHGNYALYDELEKQLAVWKEREGALVFANGYQANTGVIAALAGRGDAVFSDRLNHASIVDGIVLSRAEHFRYRHNDMEHLEFLLKKHQDARRKWIVTDSIFSMDGDKAPLLELVQLREHYDAMLMVDEAHAGGVRGEEGQGLCHELGIAGQVDVLMGTFSKAFGVYGAYVCADEFIIRYLMTKARSLVYSTALPPAVIGSNLAALSVVQTESWRRKAVRQNALMFRQLLRSRGFTVDEEDTPIIPLTLGENEWTLQFSKRLRQRGIAAVAIRPPTVPAGTARIRFTVMAAHTFEELEWACEQVSDIRDELHRGGAIT
ncbi:8-amino-7-oxononanoate synthase [Brevibacillus sp. AG162]|uniref:8-amino-7-oxononanoate synthase n=1 Tax=Brevibacillus sp. AG162 TaxID=2572910 RepID=UPI00114FDAAB|nr:8-amino-7-oxononanoate synthase [Brevibacillus sp. AG162]TQK62999.1 8-amino-7-oxononanoate synthase [Brevibacillus sp. AG162]